VPKPSVCLKWHFPSRTFAPLFSSKFFTKLPAIFSPNLENNPFGNRLPLCMAWNKVSFQSIWVKMVSPGAPRIEARRANSEGGFWRRGQCCQSEPPPPGYVDWGALWAFTGCFQETSQIASLPAVLQLLTSHVLLSLISLLYRVLEASANATIILTLLLLLQSKWVLGWSSGRRGVFVHFSDSKWHLMQPKYHSLEPVIAYLYIHRPLRLFRLGGPRLHCWKIHYKL